MQTRSWSSSSEVINLETKPVSNSVMSTIFGLREFFLYIDYMIGHVIDVMSFLSVYQRLSKHTLNLALVGDCCIIIASKRVLNLAVFFQKKKLDKTSCMHCICFVCSYLERRIAFQSFHLLTAKTYEKDVF